MPFKKGQVPWNKGRVGSVNYQWKPEKHKRVRCLCGCGELTNEGSKYVYGHNLRKLERTKEWRTKISLANLGRKVSQETKGKLRIAQLGKTEKYPSKLKGKHITNEHKRKISLALKGRIPWCKGKHLSKNYHDNTVRKEMQNFVNNGFRCIPLLDVYPDFIAIKGDKAFAVEIEFRVVNPDKYTNIPYYDDIIWITKKRGK